MDDDLTIITANGVALRLKVKDVKQAGRATRGVHLIKPQQGDYVASVARIAAEDLKKAGAEVDGAGGPQVGCGQILASAVLPARSGLPR